MPRNFDAPFLFCLAIMSIPIAIERAAAQNITIPAGVTVTATQTITADGETATVEAGGTINTVISGGRGIEATANNQTVANHGTIDSGDTGIRSNGEDAHVDNDGTINAENYGVRSEGARAIINNRGIINSIEHGIRSDGDYAVITNTGTVNGDSQGTVVQIHGIRLGGQYSTVTNQGTVIAEEDGIFSIGDNALIINMGTTKGGVSGIGSQGDNSTVINAGRAITGDGSGAIKLSGINDQLILLNGSVLEGIVRFDGINQGLTVGTGLNLYLHYGGAFSSLNSPLPMVHDAANSLVVAVDPTGFATAGPWLQTISGAVQDAVTGSHRDNAANTLTGNSRFSFGTGELPAKQGWASAYGGYQSQSGSDAVSGASQTYGGIVSGGGIVSDERIYGVFGGGGFSRIVTDGNQQRIDVSSVYGGFHGRGRHGVWLVNTALTVGYAHHNSDRQVANNGIVGGMETATASYGGIFVSPSLTISRPIGERTVLSLGGSYAAQFLDGYQENGSAANLTVAGRTVQVAALRVKASMSAAEKMVESGTLSVKSWLGVDGAFNLGNNAVNASVAGLPLDFTAAFADAMAIGFAGIGITHQPVAGAWSFEATLGGRLGTHDYREVRATARAELRF